MHSLSWHNQPKYRSLTVCISFAGSVVPLYILHDSGLNHSSGSKEGVKEGWFPLVFSFFGDGQDFSCCWWWLRLAINSSTIKAVLLSHGIMTDNSGNERAHFKKKYKTFFFKIHSILIIVFSFKTQKCISTKISTIAYKKVKNNNFQKYLWGCIWGILNSFYAK